MATKGRQDIKDWGGDTVLSVGTGRKETFQMTFIQSLDPDVLKEVYGQENVKIASGNKLVTVDHNAKDMPHRVFVIEMIMQAVTSSASSSPTVRSLKSVTSSTRQARPSDTRPRSPRIRRLRSTDPLRASTSRRSPAAFFRPDPAHIISD